MIRTCKQLEKALREKNDMAIVVEKFEDKYRVCYGGYQEWCYSLKELVQEMRKETVALNYALWCKDESKKTIYIKGIK